MSFNINNGNDDRKYPQRLTLGVLQTVNHGNNISTILPHELFDTFYLNKWSMIGKYHKEGCRSTDLDELQYRTLFNKIS